MPLREISLAIRAKREILFVRDTGEIEMIEEIEVEKRAKIKENEIKE